MKKIPLRVAQILLAAILLSRLFVDTLNIADAFWHGGASPPAAITCNFNTGVATGSAGPCVSPVAACTGSSDDTASALSFKTWALSAQGSGFSSIQLNYTGTCRFSFNSTQIFWIKGIRNLIVAGSGVGSSSIVNASEVINPGDPQPILLGGAGQFGDNLHSVRLQTVTAGNNCVTLKTTPTATISNVTESIAHTSAFTASIAGNGPGLGILTVTVAPSSGTLAVGQTLIDSTSGTILPNAVFITSLGTGTGGTGTYNINTNVTIASTNTFTAVGVPRLTVNSTGGFTSGDTPYIAGVVASGGLDQLVNGLRWVKVVDGTHLDIFQSNFQGAYTSGGTIGGDRTTIFTVGQYALITGFATQAYWANPFGFPSNPHWFEYVKVSSINSGTGQICFDTPLANTYKSTWPQFNLGSTFQVDQGGPATLYALDPTWDSVIEYRDMTLDPGTFQATANGKTITFRNVTWINGCIAPSQNLTWSVINSDLSTCIIEMDKNIVNFVATGGTARSWKFQSSSTGTATLTNHTVTLDISGTPKSFVGTNVTSPVLKPGAFAYGISYDASCTNCSLGDIQQGSFSSPADDTSHTLWSMSGGIITIPNTLSAGKGGIETQTHGFVPGANVFWKGSFTTERIFQVLDVTQDLDNIYVTTTEVGGFPAVPRSGGTLSVLNHPAPKFTCTNCTGSRIAIALSQCTAQLPLYSCWKETYTGSASGTTPTDPFQMWGFLTSLKLTNSTPYTGSGALSWHLSQFDNWNVLKSDNTTVSFGAGSGPAINLKISPAQTRTLTSTTATNTQSGDVLTPINDNFWFGGTSNSGQLFSSNTPSDSPVVTLEMLTNQGVIP